MDAPTGGLGTALCRAGTPQGFPESSWPAGTSEGRNRETAEENAASGRGAPQGRQSIQVKRGLQGFIQEARDVWWQHADSFAELSSIQRRDLMANRSAGLPQASGSSRDFDHRASAFGLCAYG
jgi:hypothetical protein